MRVQKQHSLFPLQNVFLTRYLAICREDKLYYNLVHTFNLSAEMRNVRTKMALDPQPKIIHLEFVLIYCSRRAFAKIPRRRNLHPE